MARRMYKCQVCGEQVAAGQARQLIVIKELCDHPFRFDAFQKWVVNPWNGRWKWDWVPDIGGRGERIVKEIAVCSFCKKASERPTK